MERMTRKYMRMRIRRQEENASAHLISYAVLHRPDDMADLARKIRALRRQRGLTQKEFADQLGTDQSSVSRWESGSMPGFEHLVALAQMAGEEFNDFAFGGQDVYSHYREDVPVIGAVQAGQWVESIEWPADERFMISVPPDPRYPSLKRQGFLVRGTSINRVFPEGTILLCISSILAQRDPSPGEYVVVQKRGRDGLIEVTVKEFQLDDLGAPWLWPRSTDPAHQQPVQLPAPAEGDENDDIHIGGIVVASYRLEGPRSPPPPKNHR